MSVIEREKTYLAKYLPEGLKDCRFKQIVDIYIPASENHPTLRIRKNGDTYEMTKKTPINGSDSSEQTEHTISLTPQEFKTLEAVEGKRVQKDRYYYDYKGRTAEIDIFGGDLNGLVEVDFEFDNSEEKDTFDMPDFCLADVTQEKTFAGGMLAGKSYADLKEDLDRYNYVPLSI